MTAEKRLATAVIQQAIDDILDPHPRDVPGNQRKRLRDEAIAFLCRSESGWKRSREFWCTIADIDPVALRERMLAKLLQRVAA